MTRSGRPFLALNCGRGAASAYCSKLLAEVGVDVVMAEPPGGHPLRLEGGGYGQPVPTDSDEFVYLAAGVGSVAIESWPNFTSAEALDLLSNADAIIHDFQPAEAKALGLDNDSVRACNPHAFVVAITPFGSSGPYCDMPASDLTVYALSGHLQLTGRPEQAPIMPYGRQPSLYAGVHGAVATLAMFVGRIRGHEVSNVEVSVQEALAGALDSAVNEYTYVHALRGRYGNRTGDDLPLADLYSTVDGRVMVCVYTDAQWASFCNLLGRPEWLADDELRTVAGRRRRSAELETAMRGWFGERSTSSAFSDLQNARIPASPFSTLDELLVDPQLTYRSFFDRTEVDGQAIRLPTLPFTSTTGRSRSGVVPRLGETVGEFNERPPSSDGASASVRPALPLQGLRVLDFTHAWAGPYASMELAFLGAEVLKIEGATRPDGARYVSRHYAGEEPSYECGGYFHEFNRAKKSVVLNLEVTGAREIFLELVQECDVLITNFSARVLPKLRLDWDHLKKANPNLVAVTMPAFGDGGPYGDYVGYGEVVEGAGGLAALSGHPPEDPIRSGVAYADPLAGLYAALAATSGLLKRYLDGTGEWFDVSHQECVARMVGDAIVRHQRIRPDASAQTDRARHLIDGAFPSAGSDEWIAISIASVVQRQALRKVVCPDSPSDISTEDLRRATKLWTLQRSKHEAMRMLSEAGVMSGAALRIPELLADPHLVARGFFATVNHKTVGPTQHPGAGFRFDVGDVANGPPSVPAPLFDEHTDEVLSRSVLRSASEVARLRAAGVVGGVPSVSSPIAQ